MWLIKIFIVPFAFELDFSYDYRSFCYVGASMEGWMPHGSWSSPVCRDIIKYAPYLSNRYCATNRLLYQHQTHFMIYFFHPKVARIHVILSNGKREQQEEEKHRHPFQRQTLKKFNQLFYHKTLRKEMDIEIQQDSDVCEMPLPIVNILFFNCCKDRRSQWTDK